MRYSRENFYNRVHKLLKTKTSVPTIDAHLHVVDFLQKHESFEQLITQMDGANIAKSVIFGMPVVKKWADYQDNEPAYYLSDNSKCYYFSMTDEMVADLYAGLSQEKQKRLAPLICGFNPTDLNAVRHVEYLLDKHPIWKGLGEILFRHDDLTNLTLGEVSRPNHEAMFAVYELCQARKLPVMVHQNSTSEWEEDTSHLYIDELTEVLDNFPKVTFVWAHCGASRRTNLTHYTGMLENLLEKYSQLYMDISWVVYDDLICDEEGLPRKRWVELFDKFPDRFFVGSDLLGHYDDLSRSMARYNSLFKLVDKETARLMAYENANRMWFRS